METLPSFVAISAKLCSKKLFMTCVTEGTLEFSPTAEVPSSKARFAMENAGDSELVHIRSCYNNKYWCSNYAQLITASANEQVNDKSEIFCTLFKPHFRGSEVSFIHVRSGLAIHLIPYLHLMLYKEASYFEVVSYGSLVRLPKHVVFKGDNGKYLQGRWQQRHEYNEFSSEDSADRAAQYEITHVNGAIRVKSLHFAKYWRRSPNWIWADTNDTTIRNQDTLFEVVKVADNVIALRNKGNENFCSRLTTEGKKSCLNAAESSTVRQTWLIVEEPVYSRKIEVHFKLKNSRMCSQTPLQVACVTVPNRTNRDHEVEQGFSYTKNKTSTWSSTTTLKTGVTTSISSKIPFVGSGEIQVSSEATQALQFGKSSSFSQTVTSKYKIPVPPMTKATIKVLATEASYDIPFFYTQTDTYYSGETVTTVFEDGVYHGVEAYDFHYDADYKPL